MQTTDNQSCDAVEHARGMYRAILALWTADLLALRARGLDRPSRRYSLGLVLRPSSPVVSPNSCGTGSVSANTRHRAA